MLIDRTVLENTLDVLKTKLGNQTEAAKALGIARSTLQNRLRQATELGMGSFFQGAQLPEGLGLRGTTTLYGPDGRPRLQWVKAGLLSLEDTIEVIKEAFKDFEAGVKPKVKSFKPDGHALTVYPIADLHFGMYAWKEETGNDYDTKIAANTLLDAYSTLIGQTPRTDSAILLNLGDYFHSDNDEQRTRGHGNKMDVDTRYARVLRQGFQLFLQTVELAKQHHNTILIRNNPGNHDPYGTLAITTALAAYYAHDERVVVDIDAAPIWHYRFGTTLLVATHGHMVRMTELPAVTAARWPEEWGKSQYRYGYTGHIHQDKTFERGGMKVEALRTVAPKDAWSTEKGYVAGRSLISITHSGTRGEVVRNTVNLELETKH